MADGEKTELRLEIGHVLFVDIIGYSKMLITEQSKLLRQLTDVVRNTEQFHTAEVEGKLVRLPTGDGMALVFRNSPEAPVQCALELSESLKSYPGLSVRMGIHSGPVNEVTDVNERTNITGAGINVAQRVMDCGDAGHILLSKHVADDLEQYPQWRGHLHELGECEVKHGVRVSVVNLYTEDLGNPDVPEKLKAAQQASLPAQIRSQWRHRSWLIGLGIFSVVVSLIALAILLVRFGPAIPRSLLRTSAPKTADTNRVSANAGAATSVPEKSIAVLPFENFSDSKENEFFADGVQDDILTALSKVADLKVISRISVMSYAAGTKRNLREIAQALGVSHILEGSVRRANEKVRVTAQLIDARTDAQMWADTYDRDLADVFAIQSEIAKTIAAQLQAKLSPTEKAAIEEPPTKDIAAHDLYVQAKLLYASSSFNSRRSENLLEAAGLLDQAVARDPDFLLAYCLLSETHSLLYSFGLDHTPARRALADGAVAAAARLRPDAGETHFARADYFYRCNLDYDRARSELALAQRALPNNAQVFALTGYIDRRESRWNESTRNLERALELDPRNWLYLQQIALSYEFLRRFSDMAAVLDRVLAILPDDIETRIPRAAIDLEWRADTRPLHETVDSIIKQNPAAARGFAPYLIWLALSERDTEAAKRSYDAMPPQGTNINQLVFPIAFWKGVVARTQGDAVAARDAFSVARQQVEHTVHEQPGYGPALCVLGLIDAGLGRKEDAISEGRKACELLPLTKEATNGIHIIEFLAVIYAWTGEKDLAIQQLRTALQHPGLVNYGQLKLHPFWDPLRGDPRFEKIVADLAPK
jgi:TolB-like protein/Flp pilus assembly protein TadD